MIVERRESWFRQGYDCDEAPFYQDQEGVGRMFSSQDERVARADPLEALNSREERLFTVQILQLIFNSIQNRRRKIDERHHHHKAQSDRRYGPCRNGRQPSPTLGVSIKERCPM